MSPRQLMAIATMLAERERRDLMIGAMAARAAQADKRGWQGFMNELEK